MPNARPFLMFQDGRAQSALDLYGSVFADFDVASKKMFPEVDGKATIMIAEFRVAGCTVLCSDSPVKHNFTFTPSSSLFVDFESRAALDAAFAKLSEGGGILMPLDNYGFSERFGWTNDRFGVSWQLNYPGAA